MALPSDLLLRVPEEAARLVALTQVEELEQAAQRLSDAEDEDVVHDVRVALRRLRSTLRSHRGLLKGSARKKDRSALKEMAHGSNAARDAEVGAKHLEELTSRLTAAQRKGTTWLGERLQSRAAKERASLEDRAQRGFSKDLSRLRRRLGRYRVAVKGSEDGSRRRFAAPWARRLSEQVERTREAWTRVTGIESAAEAHAARIEGKRLRYLLEPLGDVVEGVPETVERLKTLQDDLGLVQDMVALGDLVREALEDAAVAHVRRLHGRAQQGGARQRAPRDDRSAGLLALTREIETSRISGLRALTDGQAGARRFDEVRGMVESIVKAAEALAHEGLEIERKYLLTRMPEPRPAGEVLEVEQGWLPGERLQERVRRVRHGTATRCWRTLKTGRGLTRIEIEEETPEALFASLWPLTDGLRVRKRRHVVAEGAHHWEIDEFLDRDLVLAEVELESADETVAVPDWLAPFVVREVTDEPEYVNRNLAR